MLLDRTTYKEKVAIQTLGQFVSVKQNIDKEGMKTKKQYDVSLLPTLLVLDAKGRIVAENYGSLTTKGLVAFLKEATRKAAKTKK